LILRIKPRNRRGDFETQITKPKLSVLRPKPGNPQSSWFWGSTKKSTTGFEAKPKEIVATSFEAKLEKTDATGFEIKPAKTIATGFEAKPMKTVTTGFEDKPVKTVTTGFKAKPAKTVAAGFEAKPPETVAACFEAKPQETVVSGFEAKPLTNRRHRFWGSNRWETIPVVLKPNHWQPIDLGFKAQPRNSCSSSPRTQCKSHMVPPDLSIVRPPSIRPVRLSPILCTRSPTPTTILVTARHATPATCTSWDKQTRFSKWNKYKRKIK
jgi:hypothetical protein